MVDKLFIKQRRVAARCRPAAAARAVQIHNDFYKKTKRRTSSFPATCCTAHTFPTSQFSVCLSCSRVLSIITQIIIIITIILIPINYY